AYYFELARRSSARQVQRLADALLRYPDILIEKFQVDVAEVEIVPCVLNALPYSRFGKVDGAYFTDASALRRFFQERHFHIRAPHRISDHANLLHRVPVASVWTGDEPAPEDLIRQFERPHQLELVRTHTALQSALVPLGSDAGFAAEEYVRTEMTVESF